MTQKKRMISRIFTLAVILTLVFSAFPEMSSSVIAQAAEQSVAIYYVRPSGSKSEWSGYRNVYENLQAAIDTAAAELGNNTSQYAEVRVAAGTYTPMDKPNNFDVSEGIDTSRTYHFSLRNNVTVIGGFAGNETSNIPLGGETVLSGDLGVPDDISDNTYHVFYHPGTLTLNSSAKLCNVTITGGNADGGNADGSSPHNYGGGMYNILSSPSLINCTFQNNYANFGGGMYNFSANPVITATVFTQNTAESHGGGMYNNNANPVITISKFLANSANGWGGGMVNASLSNPQITSGVFLENTAGTYGGAIHNRIGSNPTIVSSTFTENTAKELGGGLYNFSNSNPAVSHSIISGNNANANYQYDEVYSGDSTPLFTCSVVGIRWNNAGYDIAVEPCDIVNTDGTLPTGSPAINAGNNTEFASFWSGSAWLALLDGGYVTGEYDVEQLTDMWGGPRLRNSNVDIGAYEAFSFYLISTDYLYVRNAHNATAWTGRQNVYTNLQRAIDDAAMISYYNYKIVEVRVAEGNYTPTTKPNNYDNDADVDPQRSYHYSLRNGVTVSGGFQGNEQDSENGKGAAEKTILSGDLNGDDRYNSITNEWVSTEENVYHVFYHPVSLMLDHTAKLQNVTITGGNANTDDSSLHNLGGGMFNVQSSPVILGCVFTHNYAVRGGGISNSNGSSPKITGSSFTENTASYGGGMKNDAGSAPTLTECSFIENHAEQNGGGIENNGSNPTFLYANFSGNIAGSSGGAMYNRNNKPIILYGSFIDNEAKNGGAMYNSHESDPQIMTSIFTGNTAESGGAIYNNQSSNPSVFSSTVAQNTGNGAIFNSSGSTLTGNHTIISRNNGSDITGDPGNFAYSIVDTKLFGADGIVQDTGTTVTRIVKLDGTLPMNSPAIDAGNNNVFESLWTNSHEDNSLWDIYVEEGYATVFYQISKLRDHDGNNRLSGRVVDIGAYEYYKIEYVVIGDNINGQISIGNSNPAPSSTVTVTTFPDAGYRASGIRVIDSNGKLLEQKKVNDSTFSFVYEGIPVTVTGEFVRDTGWNPFTDVPDGIWYYEDVKYIWENGIVDGTSPTTFSPGNDTNRAMVATVLWRMEGEPATDAENPFSDLNAEWYKTAVIWAADKGIVEGVGGSRFAPGSLITREQMATMLYRYAEWKDMDVSNRADLSQYSDVADISTWGLDAVKWANAEEILTGRTETLLSPKGTTKRAELAAFLRRFLSLTEE